MLLKDTVSIKVLVNVKLVVMIYGDCEWTGQEVSTLCIWHSPEGLRKTRNG